MVEEEKLECEEIEEERPTEILPKERRVHSDKTDRSIFELYRQYQKGMLELRPEFQRLHVWNNKKSSCLIESVLLEVPIPVIYLSEESEGKYAIIDGQQRLNAFFDFLENKLRLTGLTVLLELNGKKYQDLSPNLQGKFENSTIRIIEIRRESHPDVKFEIFERLNTGAVQLNHQELRNCIYRGRYNELLKDLSEDKDFQFLLGLKGPHYRMNDREFILRFFAFYHNTYLKYNQPMKRFLNKEMERYEKLSDIEENELSKVFKKSIRMAKTVFGEKAFKRFVIGTKDDHNGYSENKINKGLFDIIMFGFTMFEENQIVSNSDAIREELMWQMTSNFRFIDSISGTGTDNKVKIERKFEIWVNSLRSVIGYPETEPRNFTLNLKKQLWESNPTCAICRQKIHLIDDAEVDHIEQYWRGGKTIPQNARLTHRYCNRARSHFEEIPEKVGVEKPWTRGTKITRTRGAIPQKEYRLPILEALSEKGGRATQREVFEIIERKLGSLFNDLDLEILRDGYTVRWQKMAAWQKYIMVKEGILRHDPPRGIWEITEKGRKFLENSKWQKATNSR